MVGQTKLQSLFEALCNIAIGLVINIYAQTVLFPVFGCEVTLRTNFKIAVCFTIISLIRQYTLRRGFNRLMQKLWKN